MITMADLTDGTRIRHPRWDWYGTVKIRGGAKEIQWDGSFVADGLGDNDVIRPEDLEIIGEG